MLYARNSRTGRKYMEKKKKNQYNELFFSNFAALIKNVPHKKQKTAESKEPES